MARRLLQILFYAVFLVGCAGVNRWCSSCSASALGADWVVVKNDLNGKPFRCWTLTGTSVTSETQSDGIYWKSPDGHLVHIAGNYDYVQVVNGEWDKALGELGLTKELCRSLQERQFTAEQLGLPN